MLIHQPAHSFRYSVLQLVLEFPLQVFYQSLHIFSYPLVLSNQLIYDLFVLYPFFPEYCQIIFSCL